LNTLTESFKSVIKRDTERKRGFSDGFSFSALFGIRLGQPVADLAHLICVDGKQYDTPKWTGYAYVTYMSDMLCQLKPERPVCDGQGS
jgi:hypothetical protein